MISPDQAIQDHYEKPWEDRTWLERSYPRSVFEKPALNSITYANKEQADGIFAIPIGRDGEDVIWASHYFDGAVWREIGFNHTPVKYYRAEEALRDARLARDEILNK